MAKLINWHNRVRQYCTAFVISVMALTFATSYAGTSFCAEAIERWTRSPRSPFVGIVKETCKSVVSIQGEKKYEVSRGAGRASQCDVFNGMGTGVVIDERGLILTNYHVVKGLLKLEVITSDGEHYRDVELIRNDVATDLAILKIKPKTPLHKITMGRSENVELAEDVFAIGNPYGYHCSITRGIVSALERPLEVNDTLSYERVIQTDAAINPGNSGGPLINLDGEMIGLNAAVREDAENIAFAIPIDVVSEVVERMLRQTVAKMTHHGLKFRVVAPDDDYYPEDGDGRDYLLVDSVDPKSPGFFAGVKQGDVILRSNGYAIRSSLDFTCSLIGMNLSDSVELELERNSEIQEAVVAFSGLSKEPSRKNMTAHTDHQSKRYANAETSESFTNQAIDSDQASGAPIPNLSSDANEAVWETFGIAVETIDSTQFRKSYSKFQAVAVGEFNFALSGGVRVTNVADDSILSAGDVKLQTGDLLFGFGFGFKQEDQISVQTLDELNSVAHRLDELKERCSGKARLYLIRKDKPYFLEIELPQEESISAQ